MTGRKVVVGLLTEDQEFQQMQATNAREVGARLEFSPLHGRSS